MSSSALAAYGTLLKKGAGTSPETYTTVAEVTNLSGPSMKMDSLDVTHHGSSEGYKDFVGGLIDGGEIKVEANLLPNDSSHTGLLTDMNARTLRAWQIVFPTSPAKTWSFNGLIQGIETAAPVDGKLALSLTIKVSGKPTLA
jgi:predicted secreted protein